MSEKDPILLEIAERLKIFAKRNFKTIANLAKEMGLSDAHLRQYSNAQHQMGSLMLRKLSQLGCDTNWLLTGSGHEPIDAIKIKKEVEKELKKKLGL